jgi:DNA-binding transcriptional ArsR family regulator
MHAFEALADPTRRRIGELLAAGERAAGEIAGQFEVSAPAISQHLKALREAGLVRVRAEAQRRIYSLDPQGLREVDAWLNEMRAFWSGRLDSLEQELRRPPKRKRSRT